MNLQANETKLILFDLDDTLYDFSSCWESGMREAIRLHPLTSDLDTEAFYQRLKYYSDVLWDSYVDNTLNLDRYRRLRLDKALGEFGKSAETNTANDFQAFFSVQSMAMIKPLEETTILLNELAQRYRMGIVTNGPADMTYIKLKNLGVDHLFSEKSVFISELVGYHKPDRRIFAHVLERMEAAPQETLFVGDTWGADVVGAMDAGIPAVWINAHGRVPESEHVPFAVIQSLGELRKYVMIEG